MKSKGLFELMFMLLMLTLLFPMATKTQHMTTSRVQSQTSSLSLLSDQAIADAFADQTFVNCTVASIFEYQTKANAYLSTLKTTFNSAGTNCDYNLSILTRTPSTITGEIDISCQQSNSDTSTYLKKRFYFDKDVTASGTNPGSCRVTVIDNLSSYTQVDYNITR